MRIFFVYIVNCLFLFCFVEELSAFSVKDIFSEQNDIIELIELIESNDFVRADEIIKLGVSLESRGKNGETILWWFVNENNLSAAKYLYGKGASPMIQVDDDRNLLELSAANNDSVFLELALKHGGNPNLISEFWRQTPIFTAVITKNTENLKILIRKGAYLNIANPLGVTPLLLACDMNYFEGVVLLLEAGANNELRDRFGHSVEVSINESMIAEEDEEFDFYLKVKSLLNLN